MKVLGNSNNGVDYFTILCPDKILLYQNTKLILEVKKEDIVSIVLKEDYYLFTKKGNNNLFGRNLKGEEIFEYKMDQYQDIELIKFINNTEMVIIRGYSVEKQTEELFIYDIESNKLFCKMPSEIRKGTLYDIAKKSDCIHVLCFCRKNISKFPDYNLDVEDTYLVTYKINGENLELIDKLSVICTYDDFDDKETTITKSMNFMQFPLFSHFLYFWLEEKSFSASGERVVYYSEDIHGLIISEIRNGDVYKLVSLPSYLCKEDFYYYNDITGILSVVNEKWIKQFKLVNSDKASGDEIEILNQKYKEAQAKNVNLQRHEEGFSFKRSLFRAIESNYLTECK